MTIDPTLATVLVGSGGAVALIFKSFFDYRSSSRHSDTTDRITNGQQIQVLFDHVTEVQRELREQRKEFDAQRKLDAATIDSLQDQIHTLSQQIVVADMHLATARSQIKALEEREGQLERERDGLRERVLALETQLRALENGGVR